jgi:hypothetical protein
MKKPFTLVEVLIAMSVLSVFLLGLMQFYSSTETVLSSGVERTEMFERARIAMDMMANDLACVFYSQTERYRDENNNLPLVVDDSGNSFSVVTIRPEKMRNSSAKTNIVAVKYSLESEDTDAGEESTGTKSLFYSYDKNGDNFTLKGASFGNKTELVEGVTNFDVKAVYGKWPGEDKRCEALPAVVVISMRIIDSKTMKRLKANPSLQIDEATKTREFRRMIVIDRGQPKPKL